MTLLIALLFALLIALLIAFGMSWPQQRQLSHVFW